MKKFFALLSTVTLIVVGISRTSITSIVSNEGRLVTILAVIFIFTVVLAIIFGISLLMNIYRLLFANKEFLINERAEKIKAESYPGIPLSVSFTDNDYLEIINDVRKNFKWDFIIVSLQTIAIIILSG